MGLGSGMGLSSETRFDFGHISVMGALFWTLCKAFPVQECSNQKQSGKAIRRGGKDVKGFHTRREPMRMLRAVVVVSFCQPGSVHGGRTDSGVRYWLMGDRVVL